MTARVGWSRERGTVGPLDCTPADPTADSADFVSARFRTISAAGGSPSQPRFLEADSRTKMAAKRSER